MDHFIWTSIYNDFHYGRGNSFVEPSTVAYEQVFGPYHGWTVKKAVVAALQELPSRDVLFKTINEDGKYSMLLYILLMDFIDMCPFKGWDIC